MPKIVWTIIETELDMNRGATLFVCSEAGSQKITASQAEIIMLMGYYCVEHLEDLVGKDFESESETIREAFKELIERIPNVGASYPGSPMLWKISSIESDHQGQYVVRMKVIRPKIGTSGGVTIRESAVEKLMHYFHVKVYKQLENKTIELCESEAKAAIYALLLNIVDPNLI